VNKYQNFLLLFAALVLGFLGGQAGSIVSAHGGETSRIHACFNNHSGEIKIIDADGACQNGFSPLDWDIQGPPGPQGNPGISELEVVWISELFEGEGTIAVNCPEGKKAMGGGADAIGPGSLLSSRPIGPDITGLVDTGEGIIAPNGTSTMPTGWQASGTGGVLAITAYAICAHVEPQE
jgi:hypothetical protein